MDSPEKADDTENDPEKVDKTENINLGYSKKVAETPNQADIALNDKPAPGDNEKLTENGKIVEQQPETEPAAPALVQPPPAPDKPLKSILKRRKVEPVVDENEPMDMPKPVISGGSLSQMLNMIQDELDEEDEPPRPASVVKKKVPAKRPPKSNEPEPSDFVKAMENRKKLVGAEDVEPAPLSFFEQQKQKHKEKMAKKEEKQMAKHMNEPLQDADNVGNALNQSTNFQQRTNDLTTPGETSGTSIIIRLDNVPLSYTKYKVLLLIGVFPKGGDDGILFACDKYGRLNGEAYFEVTRHSDMLEVSKYLKNLVLEGKTLNPTTTTDDEKLALIMQEKSKILQEKNESKIVHVTNLPLDTRINELVEEFKEFKIEKEDILFCELKDKDCCGEAFITLQSIEDVHRAEKRESKIGRHVLKVLQAHPLLRKRFEEICSEIREQTTHTVEEDYYEDVNELKAKQDRKQSSSTKPNLGNQKLIKRFTSEDNPKPRIPNPPTIFVRMLNLPERANATDVKNFFSPILPDKILRTSASIFDIEFYNVDHALEAMEKHGLMIRKNKVELIMLEERPKRMNTFHPGMTGPPLMGPLGPMGPGPMGPMGPHSVMGPGPMHHPMGRPPHLMNGPPHQWDRPPYPMNRPPHPMDRQPHPMNRPPFGPPMPNPMGPPQPWGMFGPMPFPNFMPPFIPPPGWVPPKLGAADTPTGEESNQNSTTKAVPASPAIKVPELPSNILEYKVPPQDGHTPVGQTLIIPMKGYFCQICNKFYNNQSSAKVTHCKTKQHYEKLKQFFEKKKIEAQKIALREEKARAEEMRKMQLKKARERSPIVFSDRSDSDSPPRIIPRKQQSSKIKIGLHMQSRINTKRQQNSPESIRSRSSTSNRFRSSRTISRSPPSHRRQISPQSISRSPSQRRRQISPDVPGRLSLKLRSRSPRNTRSSRRHSPTPPRKIRMIKNPSLSPKTQRKLGNARKHRKSITPPRKVQVQSINKSKPKQSNRLRDRQSYFS